jgi:hypothetical protein
MTVATPAAPAKANIRADADAQTRLNVLSRTVAGVVAGYGMSALLAACLAVMLPGDKAEAVLTGTLISFLVYTAAIIWAYAAASHWRAWVGVLVPAALFGALFLAFH